MAMRRTRKWAFVEQEATRLANVGLSGYAIAKRLGVNESTVSRWVKAGKLTLKTGERTAERETVTVNAHRQTPDEWASAVRKDYALDATDDQLVTMAEATLRTAQDPTVSITARLSAMARFQALVRQLSLVARAADEQQPAAPSVEASKPKLRVVRRPAGDPRRALMAAGG